MGGKKLVILLVAALGGAAFAGAFTFSLWISRPEEADGAADEETAAEDTGLEGIALESLEARHLTDLIREVRDKARQYDLRALELDERERRLGVVRADLDKQAEELDTLVRRLEAAAARLDDSRRRLDETRIAVTAAEEKNLKEIAARYDLMDSQAGGELLTQMCANEQEADAVKILKYMSERKGAQLLAEMADRKLAAHLSELMKRVQKKG